MKSKTFEGKDEFDLDQQVFAWRLANPKALTEKTHPDEDLPVGVARRAGTQKNSAPNLVRRRIDYETL